MATRSKNEEKIIDLLKKQGSMNIDELVNQLFQEYRISEREVKETMLRLREKGKIRPNHQWEMEYIEC